MPLLDRKGCRTACNVRERDAVIAKRILLAHRQGLRRRRHDRYHTTDRGSRIGREQIPAPNRRDVDGRGRCVQACEREVEIRIADLGDTVYPELHVSGRIQLLDAGRRSRGAAARRDGNGRRREDRHVGAVTDAIRRTRAHATRKGCGICAGRGIGV